MRSKSGGPGLDPRQIQFRAARAQLQPWNNVEPKLANRLAEEGQVESLEDLEHAVHFGDLAILEHVL